MLTPVVRCFSPDASRFPNALFFPTPPWLVPCYFFIPECSFLYSSFARKLSLIPLDPVPASSSFSLRVHTPLFLTTSLLCLCLHLDLRRVALSSYFTSYTHGLQHLPHDTSFILAWDSVIHIYVRFFPGLWAPCTWGLQLYLPPAHCLIHSTFSKLFVKNKTLTCQYPDIFWVSRNNRVRISRLLEHVVFNWHQDTSRKSFHFLFLCQHFICCFVFYNVNLL